MTKAPDSAAASPVVTRGALLAVIAFILYGSLYPFIFERGSVVTAFEAWRALAFTRPSRGDLAANLLLYLPLGALVAANLQPHPLRFRLLATMGTAALLAVLIETLQQLEPSRVSSATDVLLNIGGAAAGCIAHALYRKFDAAKAWQTLATGRAPLVPTLLIATWLLSRGGPYVPTISLSKYRAALAPVMHWDQLTVPDALRHGVAWTVIAFALNGILRTAGHVRVGLTMLMGMTLAAQVVIVNRELRPSELVGMIIAASMFGLWHGLAAVPVARALTLLVVAAVVVNGLMPYALLPAPGPFGWMPFHGSLSGNLELNLSALLEKSFVAGAFLWLLVTAKAKLAHAAVLGVALWGAIEFAQRWLPGRTAEITDPLLVLLLAGCFAWMRLESAGVA